MFENRSILYDFSSDLTLTDITKVRNIAMNSKTINIFVLMYTDIEVWLREYISFYNVRKGPNSWSYYFNNMYDNRLLICTLNFHDSLWRLGIKVFREMYSSIFSANDIRGLEMIEQYPELKRLLVNLIKCNSMKKVNDMFVQNIEMMTSRKEKDNNRDKNYYKSLLRSNNLESDDKMLALFEVSTEEDFRLVDRYLIKLIKLN